MYVYYTYNVSHEEVTDRCHMIVNPKLLKKPVKEWVLLFNFFCYGQFNLFFNKTELA